jgi:type I restriction enzyme S subunit
MEVKPGYKQTEVGVIPESWDVCNLATISSKITDGDHVTPKREREGYYLLSARNVRDGNIDVSDVDYVGQEEYQRMRQRCAPEVGDILISCSGHGLGRVAIVPEGLQCVLVRSAALVKLDRKDVNSLFIQYWLQGTCAQNQISSSKSLAAQPNLFINSIERLRCPLPPSVTEQLGISEALSDVDALLGGLERLITKKLDLKQAAMQQLLTGKTRLPGFHGKWEVKRLDELADIRSGGTPSTDEPRFWDGDVPWCTPTDITALGGHKYLRETSRRITQQGLQFSSAEVIPAYSVVMTSRATIGECAINEGPVSTNQGFKNLVPLDSIDVEFLYYLLASQKQRFISVCGGSTFLEISKGQLAEFEVRLPATRIEQTAIAVVLADMDAELEALEQRLSKTRDIKQAMMQELLTGKTRLISPQEAHA